MVGIPGSFHWDTTTVNHGRSLATRLTMSDCSPTSGPSLDGTVCWMPYTIIGLSSISPPQTRTHSSNDLSFPPLSLFLTYILLHCRLTYLYLQSSSQTTWRTTRAPSNSSTNSRLTSGSFLSLCNPSRGSLACCFLLLLLFGYEH